MINTQNDIIKMLDEEDWYKHFCFDGNEMKKYVIDEQSLEKETLLSAVGNIVDEETALKIIRVLIVDNIEEVAEWSNDMKSILRISHTFDAPVGYIMSCTGSKTMCQTVKMMLIRERERKTTFGFYVAGIVPVMEEISF